MTTWQWQPLTGCLWDDPRPATQPRPHIITCCGHRVMCCTAPHLDYWKSGSQWRRI